MFTNNHDFRHSSLFFLNKLRGKIQKRDMKRGLGP